MESRYRDALMEYGTTFYVVGEVNLMQDSFQILYAKEGYDTSSFVAHKQYSKASMFPLEDGILHPEDESDYLSYMDVNFLKNYFKSENHNTTHWVKFRSKYGQRDRYHWMRTEFVLSPASTDENQIVYYYLRDMQTALIDNRLLFEDALRELSENFEAIFHVDLEKDEVFPYRYGEYVSQLFGNLLSSHPSYAQVMMSYIRTAVVEKDRQEMLRVCSAENIVDQLSRARAFSYEYRVFHDEKEMVYRVKFARVDEKTEIKRFIIGFANVSEEVFRRKEYFGMGRKALIVEDQEINREILSAIIGEEYEVLVAKDGKEAMNILSTQFEDIAIVLTDLEMPNMGGTELISQMKKLRFLSSIPIIVTTSHTEGDVEKTCIELGASDFIMKPYNAEMILRKMRSFIRLRESIATINVVEKDELTGLYNKEFFYRYGQRLLDEHKDKEYAILISDIENFKVVNERYGKEKADDVLRFLSAPALDSHSNILLAGRLNADVFACIISEEDATALNEEKALEIIRTKAPIKNLSVKYGYYYTREDRSIPMQQMCDRAVLALATVKGVYNKISAVYTREMSDKLLREKRIVDSMNQALAEEQFVVYYQPKHELRLNRVGGSEALIRWVHPEYGFMNPGEFIPLFERNGFITSIDKFVLERVCKDIREWIDEGLEPMPVSINISRRDLESPEFATVVLQIVERYEIPYELIHLEITETAFSDHMDRIIDSVKQIHEMGFVIELDDFGTGYTSLAMLNALTVDEIKLDISLIKTQAQETEKSVLDFAMQLAKFMKLKTVQEGVETKEQLERVKALGCDLVQGYYFSKPLTKENFTEYFKEINHE